MANKKKKFNASAFSEFKKIVRRSAFLTSDEDVYFNAIPDEIWDGVFSTNFNGNLSYAKRVLLNKFSEIEELDDKRLEMEEAKIRNLKKATHMMLSAIDKKAPIIFVTDFDNDGSLAQAVINTYLGIDKKADKNNIFVEYAQTLNGNSNRGITVDVVSRIVEFKKINTDAKFLVITADNGINSREEQLKIQEKYPNCELIFTDHHLPDHEMVIQENKSAVIFNPKYKPTEFFQEFNISGASTIAVLLKSVLRERYSPEELEAQKSKLDVMKKLMKVSNLLDYVETDPAHKPEKDYVITKFTRISPLLNINNSISKLITNEIPNETADYLKKAIPNFDVDLLQKEALNIRTQNKLAQVLLSIVDWHSRQTDEEKEGLGKGGFQEAFLNKIIESVNYDTSNSVNSNFIEQLRPHIFELSANDKNTEFLDAMNEAMLDVFEAVKVSEKAISEALRQGEIITRHKKEHSAIIYADPYVLSIFNRKFLNKVYNDENTGFSLTLDNIGKGKVSGSFRSLYNISDIMVKKSTLEAKLKIKIETPGHERAAGFIIKSTDPEKYPITDKTIEDINTFINDSIAKIKARAASSSKAYILTDLQGISVIDKLNRVIRGNIPHFKCISPILKLSKDTVWTDAYTTEQFNIEKICKEKKYGYVTINTNFHGDGIIVPVELLRRINNGGMFDYLGLGYMDSGIFMADRVVPHKDVSNLIDVRVKNNKQKEIIEAFSTKELRQDGIVKLTREQIKDNPFFKYSDYGDLNFELFEKMVIGIIDSNKVDVLSVFDVEANGFGNAKIMNFGAINYEIDNDSGEVMDAELFAKNLYSTGRREMFLLSDEAIKKLKLMSDFSVERLSDDARRRAITRLSPSSLGSSYYTYPGFNRGLTIFEAMLEKGDVTLVKNYRVNDDGTTSFNREIKAEMLAYMINDNDFIVPDVMTGLTGINQEILRAFGKKTSDVDNLVSEYYKDKKVIFGAHNIPYDAKILRVNMGKTYDVLKNSIIYDSALFSRKEKLSYDNIGVATFQDVVGLSNRDETIYFYTNNKSDYNLSEFIRRGKDGAYQDRTGRYLLEIEAGEHYLVDKVEHKKVLLEPNKEAIQSKEMMYGGLLVDSSNNVIDEALPKNARHMLALMKEEAIPNKSIKYSVQALSTQWMIRSLLLSDEKFEVQTVDIEQPKYQKLKKYRKQLDFIQKNFFFDISAEDNVAGYTSAYERPIAEEDDLTNKDKLLLKMSDDKELVMEFLDDFLEKNKKIAKKFTDAWMYKAVLSIKDPKRIEVTQDLIDLVHFQSAIPKKKIQEIFDAAIKFKKKYGIDSIIQYESHVNGPWETDSKGDILFEDKLTLSLLAQRNYNQYDHSIGQALEKFNKSAIDARVSFDKADYLGYLTANDSYSFRQGLFYDRNAESPVLEKIKAREASAKAGLGSSVLIYKLDNGVLPQGSAVFAVTKNNTSIDRETAEEDSRKLSFIVANIQLANSFNYKGCEAGAKIVNANKEICLEYKRDLATRYKYIEFSRKESSMKKLLELSQSVANMPSGMGDFGKLEKALEKLDKSIGASDIGVIIAILKNYKDGKLRVNEDLNVSGFEDVVNALHKKMKELPPTLLEIHANPMIYPEYNLGESGMAESVISDPNFLMDISIEKRDPTNSLLTSFSQMRLLNSFVVNGQVDAELLQVPEKRKSKRASP